MSVQVEIPSMGESVSEVILLEWLKGDGERVERDEPLCVLETDKANVELPSPASGALKHLQSTDTTLAIGAVSYTHRRCRRSTLCRSRWSPYH